MKSGFCLGYLRGRSFPPPPQKKWLVSRQKILLSLKYLSNYIGKIIQRRRGQCIHCNISQNSVSKCSRLHLSSYSFQKISGGHTPGPPRKLGGLGTRDFSPKSLKEHWKLLNVSSNIGRLVWTKFRPDEIHVQFNKRKAHILTPCWCNQNVTALMSFLIVGGRENFSMFCAFVSPKCG